MKRKLNNGERELTQKGINKLRLKLLLIKKELEYNKALIEKSEYLRKFDDYWRGYLRSKLDYENNNIISAMENELKFNEHTVSEMKNHLKSGVETKENKLTN